MKYQCHTKMHARMLKRVDSELLKLEAAIAAMIQAVPRFAELAEIIESIPGSPHTAANLIAASRNWVRSATRSPSLAGGGALCR